MVHYVVVALVVVGSTLSSVLSISGDSSAQVFPCSNVPYAEFEPEKFCSLVAIKDRAIAVEKCACHLLSHGMMWRAKLSDNILRMMEDVNSAVKQYLSTSGVTTDYKYLPPPSVYDLLNDVKNNRILVTLLTSGKADETAQDVTQRYRISCYHFEKDVGHTMTRMIILFNSELLVKRVISQEENLQTVFEAYAVCSILESVDDKRLLEMSPPNTPNAPSQSWRMPTN